jgi:hypothetical protein
MELKNDNKKQSGEPINLSINIACDAFISHKSTIYKFSYLRKPNKRILYSLKRINKREKTN